MTSRDLRRWRKRMKEKKKNFTIAKLKYVDCESCYHKDYRGKWCKYYVSRPKKFTCGEWTDDRYTWSTTNISPNRG